jgi:hypothetical protein
MDPPPRQPPPPPEGVLLKGHWMLLQLCRGSGSYMQERDAYRHLVQQHSVVLYGMALPLTDPLTNEATEGPLTKEAAEGPLTNGTAEGLPLCVPCLLMTTVGTGDTTV